MKKHVQQTSKLKKMQLKAIFTSAVLAAGSVLFATDAPADLNSDAAWILNKKWAFENNILTGTAGDFLYLKNTPQFNTMTFSADIIVDEAMGKSWKITGLGVVKDRDNFWRLSFVECPDADQNSTKRFVELKMMNNKKWGSTKGLKRVANRGLAWEYGKKYTMVITMTPELMDGKVLGEDGKVLAHQSFELLEGATKGGSPILTTSAFKSRFSNIKLRDTE
jgi:hypothetical protein